MNDSPTRLGLVETAILQEQSLREVSKYQAIMRAIGGGCTELSDIGQRAGLPTGTSLRDKLERLVNLGYVWQFCNLGAKTSVPFRYRILDPAMAFYYEFVSPNDLQAVRHRPRLSPSGRRGKIPSSGKWIESRDVDIHLW
jgi:hypothetical protein